MNRRSRSDVGEVAREQRHRSRPLVFVSGTALLVAMAVVVTGGSGPSTLAETYTSTVITPDGDDIYLIDQPPGEVEELTVAAPGANRSGNLRTVAVLDGVEPSTDQESCISWLGPRYDRVQPGLALRVTSSEGQVRAITVSNNVWLQDRSSFNVHLADSAAGEGLEERMVAVGKIALPSGLGEGIFTMTPLPWRMCARAEGTTISVKAWSTDEHPEEPAWDDLGFAGSVEVPPDWVHSGRPGFYMAHLAPGERAHLTNDVTRSLAAGAQEAGGG